MRELGIRIETAELKRTDAETRVAAQDSELEQRENEIQVLSGGQVWGVMGGRCAPPPPPQPVGPHAVAARPMWPGPGGPLNAPERRL